MVLGNSLLLIAAQNGRDEIIEDLLLGGADVNFGNNHKNTAIHLAAQNGWTKVMEWLLKAKNINVNAKDLHANTALHLAAQNGAIGVISSNIDNEYYYQNIYVERDLIPINQMVVIISFRLYISFLTGQKLRSILKIRMLMYHFILLLKTGILNFQEC